MTLLAERGLSLVGLPPRLIVEWVEERRPSVGLALDVARRMVPACKREVWRHQAACLYYLASEHVGPRGAEGQMLEIGTALGYSAALLSLGAPEAHLLTINPKLTEYPQALANLAPLANVEVWQERSDALLYAWSGPTLDLVFVDGSHLYEDVRADQSWWRWVRSGGLMLFHDWSPAESARPSEPVYRAVNEMAEEMGRPFDVCVVDDRGVGMAGWVRLEGDR